METTIRPSELKRAWDRCRSLPLGKGIFARALGWIVPYSGTIRAGLEEIGPGHSRIVMKDRRRVRNHLRSIHAIALMNLGELTTGLPLAYTLPADGQAILTGLRMSYLKKARGTLVGECRFDPETVLAPGPHELEATLTDASGDIVARAHAEWLVRRTD